jgi:hypothetical protein
MKIKKELNYGKIELFLKLNFSSPTHWPDWNILISKFYHTEFFYYCAYEAKELIGICPMHIEKKGGINLYYSGQFHYIPYGGWIFSKKSDLSYGDIPIPSFSHLQSFTLPKLPDFKVHISKSINKNFKTLIINLRNNLDSIWKEELDVNRRNMIRKAEKNFIQVELCNHIDCFYELYYHSNLRLGLNMYPKELMEQLFNGTINIHFEVLNAKLNNKILANIVIAYDKNYAIYWLGNNTHGVPNIGQGELLQWETIKRMKEKGCWYYDLCYIDKERLPNIYRFKSGFSKNQIAVPYINYKPFIYRTFNKIKKCF